MGTDTRYRIMAQDIIKSTAELFGDEPKQEVVKSTEELFGRSAAPKSKWEQAKELMAGMESAGTLPRVGMWGSSGAKPITETVSEAGGIGPYLGRLASKEGLETTGKAAIEGAKGLAMMPVEVVKTVASGSPSKILKAVTSFATYPVEILKAFAADPVKAIQEHPVDMVLMAVSPMVGKRIGRLKAELKSGVLTNADLASALRETAMELNKAGADFNATTALVHQASVLERNPTFIVNERGVAKPTGPASRSLIQEGLDIQAAPLAKTMEQGPKTMPRELPTTVVDAEVMGAPSSAVEAALRAYAKAKPDAYNTALRVGGEIQIAGRRMKWDRANNQWIDVTPSKELHAGARPGEKDRFRMMIEGLIDDGDVVPPEVLAQYPDLAAKARAMAEAGGETPKVGLGLQQMRPESMPPAQRAMYDRLMAQRGSAAPVQPPIPAPKAQGERIVPGRAYVVQPTPGQEPIPHTTNKQGHVTLYEHEANAVKAINDRHVPSTETTIYWMQREPILKDALFHPQKAAEHTRGLMIKDAVRESKAWKRVAPNQERIGAYLEAQQSGGPETLRMMGINEVPQLTAAEMSVVKAIRANYDKWLGQINEARKVYGHDPITGVDSYAPMLRDPKALEALGIDLVREPNVEVLKAHLNAPRLKYLQERTGAKIPVSLKAYDIYRNYALQTSKYVTEAPVISKARAISNVLKDSGNANGVRNAIVRWADHLSGQAAPDFTQSPLYKRAVTFMNRNISRAALDANVRSVGVQPTSMIGTYAELGNKYTVEGLWDNAFPKRRSFAEANSNVLSTRNFDVNVTDITTPSGRGKALARGASKVLAKTSDIAITPLKIADKEMARSTWLGAQRRGVAPVKKGGLGMSPQESYRYADEVVIRTQGSGHPSDVAQIQYSTTGKLLTVFQTFTINQWNMFKHIFGYGNVLPTKARVGQVARLLMAIEATNFLFEDVLGVRSPLPAPEHAVMRGIKEDKSIPAIGLDVVKEFGESLPVVGGTIRYANRWKAPGPAAFQVGWDAYLRITEIIKKPTLKEYDFELIGKLAGIPGATQGRKIYTQVKRGVPLPEAILGLTKETEAAPKSNWSEGW